MRRTSERRRFDESLDQFEARMSFERNASVEFRRHELARLDKVAGSPVEWPVGVYERGCAPKIDFDGDWPIMPDAGSVPPSVRGTRK